MSHEGDSEKIDLAEISTRWSSIGEPAHFAMRYSQAILAYLEALLRNSHDASDVAQDFFLKFVENGLPRATQSRGRFRDYLKVAVRNAALTFLRKKRPLQLDPEIVGEIAPQHEADADRQYVAAWSRCATDKIWRALDQHQRLHTGNYCFTVLKVSLDFPREDSEQQARRVSQAIGQPLNAAAFRKQRSRARRLFADLLLEEVQAGIESPTRERVEEELADLGLLDLLREYLREDA